MKAKRKTKSIKKTVKKPKKNPVGRPRELGESIAINLRLPVESWQALKDRADYGDVSMSTLARDAIVEWLVASSVREAIAGRKS